MVSGAIEDKSAGGDWLRDELRPGRATCAAISCHYSDDGRDTYDMNLFTGRMGMTVSTLGNIPDRKGRAIAKRLRLLAHFARPFADASDGWEARSAFNGITDENGEPNLHLGNSRRTDYAGAIATTTRMTSGGVCLG